MDASEVTLVTGASGFIGSNLVDRLAEQGHRVRALHRRPAPAGRYGNDRVVETNGDVTDIGSLQAAIKGCSCVFHLAGYARNWARDPQTYWRVNVDGLRNLLDVARASDVGRVVWTSTVMALGPTPPGTVCDESFQRPETPCYTHYAASKMDAEKLVSKYVDEFGMEVVTVNPTRVFGPGPLTEGNALARLIDAYDRGRAPLILNGGRNLANYVYVEDVVRGMLQAMRQGRPGERYLLGGELKSLSDFFDAVDAISGKRHFRISVGKRTSLAIAHLLQLRAQWFGGYPPITPPWVKAFLEDWAYSSKKAEEELGYRPMAFEESMRITYEWLIRQRSQASS